MNTDDQSLDLIEEYLGEDAFDFDGDTADLLDADWDGGDDLFAGLD